MIFTFKAGRVALRVAQGGHNIPEDVIRRRFKAGLENFYNYYSKAVNSWALYDNYGINPKLLDWENKWIPKTLENHQIQI